MERTINITGKGEELNLKTGTYKIYIIGGWNVNLNSFSIKIKNKESLQTTISKVSFSPLQLIIYKKRARRAFKIYVPLSGRYEIIFENPEVLQVKRSRLFFSNILSDFIDTDKLEVLITQKTLAQIFF